MARQLFAARFVIAGQAVKSAASGTVKQQPKRADMSARPRDRAGKAANYSCQASAATN